MSDEKDQTEQPTLDNFEAAVKRLEEIVGALGDQALPLDTAMQLFEEGISVSRTCAQHLNDARTRVEKLVEESPGVFSLDAFDEPVSDDAQSDATDSDE